MPDRKQTMLKSYRVDENALPEVAHRLFPIVDTKARFKPIENEAQLVDFLKLAY